MSLTLLIPPSLPPSQLPEFDMPAHATSWGRGYPKLICNCSRFASQCTPEPHAPKNYGDGCGDDPFDPIRDSTYNLLSGFLGEMAERFPDNFVHLGGDELSYREQCWNTTDINAWMKEHDVKDYLALEGHFIQKVQAIADKVGKQVLHWQEIFNNHINMPKNKVIVHVWKDHPTLDAVVNAGSCVFCCCCCVPSPR
jgi:hexosaminidase